MKRFVVAAALAASLVVPSQAASYQPVIESDPPMVAP